MEGGSLIGKNLYFRHKNIKMPRSFLLFPLLIFSLSSTAFGQLLISGTITDKQSGEPLAGVNIKVKDRMIGTVSDTQGAFRLETDLAPPIVLQISMIGYQTQYITVETSISDLKIAMAEQVYLGQEIVVSASRVEENVLQAGVSVEKMDIREVNSTAAPNFYDALANLKGVDMNTHSLLFKFPNARGFNGEANFRFNQLVDGIDNAPPGLSFAAGNIFGISQLDVESVEMIIGASSALYGPGGMNGTMLITSKNPFDYPGLTASVQTAMMNVGSPLNGPTPMVDANLRYARSFHNKFAFKIVAGYLQAKDWAATDYRNRLAMDDPNTDPYYNPGYDGVNVYGDDVIVPVNLQDYASDIADGVARTQGLVPGTPAYDAEVQRVIGLIPDQLITRTGYKEGDIYDYDTYNLKGRATLNYRINNDLELELLGGYARGSSIYTAQNRFALKDFEAYMGKLELRNPHYFVRLWTVKENAGKTYDMGGTMLKFNEMWKSSEDWYSDFIQSFVQNYIYPGGKPLDLSYYFARIAADNRLPDGLIQNPALPARPLPGTPEFDSIWQPLISTPVNEGGGLVIDHSSMVHAEGMYDFSYLFTATKLQVGLSHRIYRLNTNGTIFFDKPGEPIIQNQFGAYAQLIQPFFNERLNVTLSGRYDKNQYFDGRFTPRMSLVLALNKDKTHNLRASSQTAFRFPATSDQWTNLALGQMDINGRQFSFQVIGGNRVVQEAYGLLDQPVFALSGNNPFTGVPESEPYQLPVFRPETVTALEIGYKGLFLSKMLYFDTYFFHNTYNNFHAKQALVQNPGTNNESRYITTVSSANPVATYGWAVGLDLMLPGGYIVRSNLVNNTIDVGQNNAAGFQARFNTPPYKLNIGLRNYHLLNNVGFSIDWRWQEAFNWESDFGRARIAAYNTLDAQVSIKLPALSSVVKVGGANLLNNYYATGLGNAWIGGLYYVSVTFDEFLN